MPCTDAAELLYFRGLCLISLSEEMGEEEIQLSAACRFFSNKNSSETKTRASKFCEKVFRNLFIQVDLRGDEWQ